MLDSKRQTGIQLSDRQRIAWLRLIRSDNIGPVTFRDLVNHFGSAENALNALPDMSRRGGANQQIRIASQDDAESELSQADAFGARFIGIGEPHYPPDLRHIDAPPPLICVKGHPEALIKPSIGIVGSRNASINGAKFAATLARELSQHGYTITSGLARGIDAAAHRGSIDHSTIAMLAGGIDRPYPPENDALLSEMYRKCGAAISEMPMGWVPKAKDFPRRNRLIAGAALGLVVVEAAHRSGSLITARLAGNFGRLVFAVPGSPLDPRSQGTNSLIREGAMLVTSASDVMEAIEPMRQHPLALEQTTLDLGEEEIIVSGAVSVNERDRLTIAQALSPTASSIDDIIRITGIEPASVQITLLELELAGKLSRHGGARVSLRVDD